MIVDTRKNAGFYKGIHPKLDKALDYLLETDLAQLPLGKTTIDGEDVFVNVTDYQTKLLDGYKIEAHRQYIDIHITISGQELIGVSSIETIIPATDYEEEADCGFFTGRIDTLCLVNPSYFCICFPQDGHVPSVAINDAPAKVRKAVVKVRA